MDKETLSNYGWIVIAVLVLVVMIALATPFGSFVSEAVQSTTKGLFDVNKNALNAAGVPGLTVDDQEFDVPDMNYDTGESVNTLNIYSEVDASAVVATITYEEGMTWEEWLNSEYNIAIKYDGQECKLEPLETDDGTIVYYGMWTALFEGSSDITEEGPETATLVIVSDVIDASICYKFIMW